MAKYLSKEEIDTIADRVFRAYRKLSTAYISGCVLSVDPDILLGSLLGLSVEYRHLSIKREILGLTAFDEVGVEVFDEDEELFFLDGHTVLVESDLLSEGQTGRKNFTLMHEGCHHIVKHLFPDMYGQGINARRVLCYRDNRRSRPYEEYQIDRLAAAILMPGVLVKQTMSLAGLDKKIKMLNPIWRRPEYEKFCWMCSVLGVSKQALCIRMKELGLIEKEYLSNPNQIIDIYEGD